jgi:hypothetical protein
MAACDRQERQMTQTDTHHLYGDDGHLNGEGVALYVDALKLGRMDGLPPSMLDHVRACMECKQEITGLFALVADEQYPRSEPHPFFDRDTRGARTDRRLFYRMAAGLAAVLGIGALTYSIFFRSHDAPLTHPVAIVNGRTDSTGQTPPRVPPPGAIRPREDMAARFERSPELEDLVNSTARSEETAVHSPANGTVVRNGDRFSWSTPALPPFNLSILDNKRHTVVATRTATDSFTLRDSLPAGLYYWKITAEGSLLHVGKFLVR